MNERTVYHLIAKAVVTENLQIAIIKVQMKLQGGFTKIFNFLAEFGFSVAHFILNKPYTKVNISLCKYVSHFYVYSSNIIAWQLKIL